MQTFFAWEVWVEGGVRVGAGPTLLCHPLWVAQVLGRTVAALLLTLANAASAEQLEALLKGHESVTSFRRIVGARRLPSGFIVYFSLRLAGLARWRRLARAALCDGGAPLCLSFKTELAGFGP